MRSGLPWMAACLLLAECMIGAGRETGYLGDMIRKSKLAETMSREVLALSPVAGRSQGPSTSSTSGESNTVPVRLYKLKFS
jgi:hypothetical protein